MFRALTLAIALAATLAAAPAGAAPKRPNILIIVADDLGYSDIGAFGGEIDTPNLDRLAARGVRLTGFHTAPTCSPTRSMLMSGTDNHLAGLGSMDELIAPNQRGKPGYEGYLRPDIASLAERMAAGGYRTLFSGKWHLGLAPDQDPHARGFQHSFAMLRGAHDHFGGGLSTDPKKGFPYTEDGRLLTALPADFYSSDAFAAKLVDQMRESRTGAGARKPFFAYLAFTAPHWPLQAPPEMIAKYHGRYDDGFEALRKRRMARQVELGLIDPAAMAHPIEMTGGGWASLTPDQKAASSRAMEIYAGMVDRMDQNIGKVLDALKASGELDDTVILFFADNGAEGVDGAVRNLPASMGHAADNRLENMGGPTSFVTYGPGWAQAATAPSWRFKAHSTEGGAHTPAIVAGPGVARAGGVAPAYANVMDVLPTLLDLAGLPAPTTRFAGREVQPVRGVSWARWLRGGADRVHGPEAMIGGELFGSRAMRQGDWKIVDDGDGKWRLFNIARDPGENHDLGDAEPERRAALVAAWDTYAKDVGVVLPDLAGRARLP